MAPPVLSGIIVEYIDVRRTLTTLVDSLIRHPNNPASLYLAVDHRSLVIYMAPALTINIVDLGEFSSALHQGHESALALKSVLEATTTTKVFFDARTPARILYDRCGIKLAIQIFTQQSNIHEVQMMELALRRNDSHRQWLATFDKCIAKDSNLSLDGLLLGVGYGDVALDDRILHLPILWKRYHDLLTAHENNNGQSFWIAQIREATQKRLEVSCGKEHVG
ncbi:3'-5' exonuclease [Paraphaeosphaeria sporulosa]